MPEATIEIRSRDVEKTDWIGYINDKTSGIFGVEGVPQHTFIIYTDNNNQKTIIRGGPKNNNMLTDNIFVVNAPYIQEYSYLFPGDYLENAPSQVIATGSDCKLLFDKMWVKAQEINAGNFDYKLPTPGCPVSLCHVQNSNTVVKALVEAAGLKLELPTIDGKKAWAPGIDGKIDNTMIDDFITNINEGIKKQQEVIVDLFSSFDKPEITNPKLNNVERLRLAAQFDEENGNGEYSPQLHNIADQLGKVLEYLGNIKFNNIDDEAAEL